MKSEERPARRPARRGTRIPAYVLLALLTYVLAVLLEGLLIRLPDDLVGAPSPGERIGAVHIHTKASDGSGTVPEVTAAARGADLSFIAITDHNVAMDQAAVADDPPDFSVISGEEVTTFSGHFLTLGIPPGWQLPPTKESGALLTATRAAGGFNIIAHPFHTNIPWTGWESSDFDAIEVWNEDEVWRRDNWIDLFNAVLLYGVNDRLALVRLADRPSANFAQWDELLAQRPVVGMCGADAHAAVRLGRGRILRFPGYTTVFRVARQHVLLGPNTGGGDPSRASAEEILDALRHGRAFCALDALYPSGGFVSRVSSGGSSGGPGDFVTWAKAGSIHISVPRGSPRPLIKVIHDGREMMEKEDWTLDAPLAGPGRYRTEVYLRQPGLLGWRRWALWIFSNPVYVTAPSDAAPPTTTNP